MDPKKREQMKLLARFLDRGWEVKHWNATDITIVPKIHHHTEDLITVTTTEQGTFTVQVRKSK